MDLLSCPHCQKNYQEKPDNFQYNNAWNLLSNEKYSLVCSCGHMIFLDKKSTSWYDPKKNLRTNLVKLFENISKTYRKVPGLSQEDFELYLRIHNNQVTMEELTTIVKQDSNLKEEVLLATHSKNKASSLIKDVSYGIAFIGLSHLKNIILINAIKKIPFKTQLFSQKAFWHKAYLTASLSELLAERFGYQDQKEECYTAGYLCNIGKVIASQFYPEKVDRVYKLMTYPKGCTKQWPELENQVGLIHHGNLGEIACAHWSLPPLTSEVVARHHSTQYEKSPDEKPTAAELVSFCNQLYHYVSGDVYVADAEIIEHNANRLKLDDEELRQMIKKCQTYFSKINNKRQHIVKEESFEPIDLSFAG